jgi:hypothetical protein
MTRGDNMIASGTTKPHDTKASNEPTPAWTNFHWTLNRPQFMADRPEE